ncbi:MAG TPA: molybdenum cofactor guanylyltransferase [Polyangia bacterium]|nr:molybdenum cofactor guanylyltransferase [Polyangia bacterium]
MTAPKTTIAAAILAGGRARRLGGGHKGLVEVGGRAIVARQLAALKPYVDACFIVANDADAYAGFGVRVVPDVRPDRGPLAGIEAAFAASDAAELLVFACDLPFIAPAAIVAAPPAAVVVARAGDVVQPLHARYSRAILPRLHAQLAANTLRLFDLVDALEPRYVDVEPRAVFNVNTREDLARAEALAATCPL